MNPVFVWRAALVATALSLVPWSSAHARSELEVSLKKVTIPEPTTIGEYIADRDAAIRLGKALFWDVRVGSDGQTACATCHHQAGVDSRTKNIFHPGPDGQFSAGIAPGTRSAASLFPLTKFTDPANRFSTRTQSIDDVAGSAGVMRELFLGLTNGGSENCSHVTEPVFVSPDGKAQRQVTGRNAPSVVNAVFNVRQFWDGRANAWFNGANPFGPVDPTARVWKIDPTSGTPVQTEIRVDHASLASQAVGPVGSDVEMAAHGRNWTDVAKKILDTTALATQQVSASDSVLGGYALPHGGISATYRELVDAAFRPEWRSDLEVQPGTSLSQANMALYFGLAVQLYESTLVSDDSRYDQWMDANGAMGGAPGVLSDQELRGLRLFFNADPRLPRTNCQLCHMSSLFTGATYEGEGGGGGTVPGIGMFPGEADSDHDGVPDIVDGFPTDPSDWLDTDGDGVGDNADNDDDDDGLVDAKDPAPLDPFNTPAGDPGDGIHAPSPILEEHSLAAVLGSSVIFREPPVGFEPSVLPMNFLVKGKGIDLLDAKGSLVAHVATQPRRTYPETFEGSSVIPVPALGEFSAFVVDMKIMNGKMTLEIGLEDFPIGQVYTVQIDGVARATLSESPAVLFESGFDNIGVRPWDEDLGLGGTHPNGVPLSPSRRLQFTGNLVEYGDLSASQGISPRVDGAFKVPTLRNIELTGPYFHNGGMSSLEDVIRFYNRGGDFHEYNAQNLAPDIRAMQLGEQDIADLAAFLRALTDERVRTEMAPFDHPALPLPDGVPLAPVGAAGRPASCGKPMQTFAENLAESDPFAGDCDMNGMVDSCEIAADPRLDHNHNGVLDVCEATCPADLNHDHSVAGADLALLLAAFGMEGAQAGGADLDGSGAVDGADLALLLGAWGSNCP